LSNGQSPGHRLLPRNRTESGLLTTKDAPKCRSRWRTNWSKGCEGTTLVSSGWLRSSKTCEGTSGRKTGCNSLSVVLAKDGESLAGLSSLQLWPSLLMLLAEGGESLVALQARSKSGERSSCASNWTDTLTLPISSEVDISEGGHTFQLIHQPIAVRRALHLFQECFSQQLFGHITL